MKNPSALIKLHAVTFGLVGLVAGILYSFGGLVIDALVSLEWVSSDETSGLSGGTLLAFGALIGMPLVFGFIGAGVGVIQVILLKLFPWVFSRFNLL